MNPLQFIRIVAAQKSLVAMITAALVLAALVVSLLLPARYTATADLLIDLTSPDPVAGVSINNSPTAWVGYVATQIDVIRSERVARHVVERLKLREQPALAARWRDKAGAKEDFTAWAARELIKELRVWSGREGNIVRVAVTAATPEAATLLANTFADTYIETAAALRRGPAQRNAAFFEQQLALAHDAVDRAREKLTVLQRDNGIAVSDESADIETARLAALSDQLIKVEREQLGSRVRDQANRTDSASSMTEVLGSALVQELKGRVTETEKSLESKTQRLGPNHPDIRALEAELRSQRTRLDAEIARYSHSVTVAESTSGSAVARIRFAVAAQRDKVVRLKEVRTLMTVHQSELETALKNLEAVSKRQVQTGMESENGLINASVLTPAVAPSQPSSPRLLLNLAIAAISGLALGVATALLLEGRAPRVRDVSDLPGATDLPLLATVPAAPRTWLALGRA
jgi:polysaccharide biosynthesis transport protein